MEDRRSASFRELMSLPPSSPGLDKLEKEQLMHMNASLGLTSHLWKYAFGPPAILLQYRIKQKIAYLEMDDILILRSGGVAAMAAEELRMACVDRGIDVVGISEEKLKELLDAWLRSKKKFGIERLLLTR